MVVICKSVSKHSSGFALAMSLYRKLMGCDPAADPYVCVCLVASVSPSRDSGLVVLRDVGGCYLGHVCD